VNEDHRRLIEPIKGLATAFICLCFMSAPTLLAQKSAEPRYPAWYRSPQLFVMTGFIANTTSGTWGPDFIIRGEWTRQKQQAALADWSKGLGREFDADKTMRAFQEAGATGVIFYDKWHDGIVPHDTHLTTFKTERDLVGTAVGAARKHGLKIVIYYSVGFDYNPDPKFQDWVCRDANGTPMGGPFPADWMSFHSPYRQYVMDQLVEITRSYGPLDGLWLDIFEQPLPSYDRFTKAAFEKRYSKPLDRATFPELAEFQIETRRQLLVDIKNSVRAVQPNMSFTFNGAGLADLRLPKSASRVDNLADFFSMEGHQWVNIDRGARTGHAMSRPFEVGVLFNSSWYVPMTDKAPPPAMSEDETIVSAATAWIQGANVYGAMTPGHSGVFDEKGDLKNLRAAGAWLKENREWIDGSAPYADIGTLGGNPSAELDAVPDVPELWSIAPKPLSAFTSVAGRTRPGYALDFAARKIGYFTEFVGGAFTASRLDLASYRMLLLPENALVNAALAQEIREYVRHGGSLLAFGHASLLDEMARAREDFALSDVLGADLEGDLPGYKQFRAKGEISSGLPLNPPALAVKPTTGKVLATWASAGNTPAIIENHFGKGHVIYASAAETVFGEGSAMLEELIGRLIGPPSVVIQSSREYVMVVNRKGNDLVIYLLNRSTGSRANTDTDRPRGSPCTAPEEIKLLLDTTVLGDIHGAELIWPKAPVGMSHRGRIIQLELPASPSVTTLRLRR
jgi:hypothetical protein